MQDEETIYEGKDLLEDGDYKDVSKGWIALTKFWGIGRIRILS